MVACGIILATIATSSSFAQAQDEPWKVPTSISFTPIEGKFGNIIISQALRSKPQFRLAESKKDFSANDPEGKAFREIRNPCRSLAAWVVLHTLVEPDNQPLTEENVSAFSGQQIADFAKRENELFSSCEVKYLEKQGLHIEEGVPEK